MSTSTSQNNGEIPIALKDYITKGLAYLESSCRPITGFQNDCVGPSRDNLDKRYFPEDVFTSLNALDLLGDHLSQECKAVLRKFVMLEDNEGRMRTGTVNFNKYAHVIPDDVEDTALYHYIFLKDGTLRNDKRIVDVARLIFLNRVEESGIIQLYYGPCEERRRGRLEAGCLSNAMRLLYYVGVDAEARETEDYLFHWLVSEKYLEGTRYYPSPDTFLFFCSKAVIHSERAKERFQQPLLHALEKRIGSVSSETKAKSTLTSSSSQSQYPLDLAFRILTMDNLNKLDSPDFLQSGSKMIDLLKNMQDPNTGAWPTDALFKLGGSDTFLGGSVVSTIFATAALIQYSKCHETKL